MTRRLLQYSAFPRALGVLLVVLAASPVTAPFSTFDVVPLAPSTPTLDPPKTKGSDGDAVVNPPFAVTSLLGVGTSCALPPAERSLPSFSVQHRVLRI